MEPCNRCGVVDRHRMIALMSRWFAVRAGLPLEGGYFYLCPACYGETVEPEFDAIAERIRAYEKPDRASREAALEAEMASQAAAVAANSAAERDSTPPTPADPGQALDGAPAAPARTEAAAEPPAPDAAPPVAAGEAAGADDEAPLAPGARLRRSRRPRSA